MTIPRYDAAKRLSHEVEQLIDSVKYKVLILTVVFVSPKSSWKLNYQPNSKTDKIKNELP